MILFHCLLTLPPSHHLIHFLILNRFIDFIREQWFFDSRTNKKSSQTQLLLKSNNYLHRSNMQQFWLGYDFPMTKWHFFCVPLSFFVLLIRKLYSFDSFHLSLSINVICSPGCIVCVLNVCFLTFTIFAANWWFEIIPPPGAKTIHGVWGQQQHINGKNKKKKQRKTSEKRKRRNKNIMRKMQQVFYSLG